MKEPAVPVIAIHEPVPGTTAIPDCQLNRGQSSNRTTEVYQPAFVVTGLYSTVVFAPASRSNLGKCLSKRVMVTCAGEQLVFPCKKFALEPSQAKFRNGVGMNRTIGTKINFRRETITGFFLKDLSGFNVLVLAGCHRFKQCVKIFINARPQVGIL
jgi:hypothetical protein